MKIRLDIEYDGTNFKGWQRQKDQRTVQSEIENALEKIFGVKIILCGSGRTDAGVHALNQVAHFETEKNFDTKVLAKAITANVSKDIVVKKATHVSDKFHAQKSSKRKAYIYKIFNREFPNPILRNYYLHISKPLDLVYLNKISKVLIGEHNFESFKATDADTLTANREIYNACFTLIKEHYVEFFIEANGFLKQMVRNIVGTLLKFHFKKFSEKKLLEILEAKDRTKAGRTAPAKGLYLKDSYY